MEDAGITPHTATVLNVFLAAPETPRYVFGLMKATGLSSGTVYQILIRLVRAGWLVASKEDIDPRAAGRPARMNYALTPEGTATARRRLTALADAIRPPAATRGQL